MKRKHLLFLWCWFMTFFLSGSLYGQVSQIRISQVYGGGGNSGAPYTHDFIELFNAGNIAASLNGLSLQYSSATGTGNFGANTGQLTELPDFTLQPGQYFLVQQAGSTAGIALPDPDLVDASPIAMAAGGGKIALVTGNSSLGCNGGSTPCSTEAQVRIIDLVGYGNANFYEGAQPAPAPSNTTAVFRLLNGCTDTDNNGSDFVTGAPAPRNSSAPSSLCNPDAETNPSAVAAANPATVAPGEEVLFTVSVTPGANPASSGITVSGDLSAIGGSASQQLSDDNTDGDQTAGDNIFSYRATVSSETSTGSKEIVFSVNDAQSRTASATITLRVQAAPGITAIYEIQGSSAASPLTGETITTTGVVVGDYQASTQLSGFFIQDATGDGNPATSDGIFVFAPGSINVTAGQLVEVTGTVAEFSGQTQISNVSGITIQEGVFTVTPAVVNLPVAATGDLESYEGMLVTFPQVLTVTQNFTLARFGEVVLSADIDYPFDEVDGRLYNPTNFIDPTDINASGVANNQDNKAAIAARQNLHRRASILLDDASTAQNPAVIPYTGPDNTLRTGSTINNLTGILSYGFNAYRIQPTQAPAFNYAPRPLTPPAVQDANLKIASFNVLNYFVTFGGSNDRGANNQAEFERRQAKIVAALAALNADVVGLIEIQNNGDGESSAIKNLTDALNARIGTQTYDYIRDPADGGTGTDAIKVAFIYKPGVVTPVGDALADPDPVHNRPPLAQTFRLNTNGERVTAVINHFKSKSGSGPGLDADQGDGQGAFNLTRIRQAEALLTFINHQVIPASGDQDVILLGDFNAYTEEDPIDVLRAGGFINLFGPESYSYVFDGQSGSLDHALVTQGLFGQFTAGGKWHINADEPIYLDYNLEFKNGDRGNTPDLYMPDPFRSSDHDPVVAGLKLQNPVVSFAAPTTVTIDEKSGEYTVTLTLSKAKQQAETVTISILTTARYGLNGKGDYITSPDGSKGLFTLTIPAGATTATFAVIPDKNAAKKKEPVSISFKLSSTSNGLTIDSDEQKNTFVLNITDEKKDKTEQLLFSVWPNPNNGAITIAAGLDQVISTPVEVTLRSPYGQVVYTGKGNLAEMSLQVSKKLQPSPKGLYTLLIIVDQQVTILPVMKF